MRPQAMLEAKDLPRCDLSTHLEMRVADALSRDAHLRARRDGLPVEQARSQGPTRGRTSNDFKTRFQ